MCFFCKRTGIKNINWIDKNPQEAEVLVSDNKFDLICFSQPFNYRLREELKEPIYCFDATEIVLAEEKYLYIEKNDSSYGYKIRAILINKNNQIVKLNDIELDLDDCHVPNDISEGDTIEFNVSRLHIF